MSTSSAHVACDCHLAWETFIQLPRIHIGQSTVSWDGPGTAERAARMGQELLPTLEILRTNPIRELRRTSLARPGAEFSGSTAKFFGDWPCHWAAPAGISTYPGLLASTGGCESGLPASEYPLTLDGCANSAPMISVTSARLVVPSDLPRLGHAPTHRRCSCESEKGSPFAHPLPH